MKIQNEDYATMKKSISALVEKNGEDRLLVYKNGLANDPKVKDLEMRFRWDLFWAAGLSKFSADVLYKYLNDEHIDTALRSIVSELKLS